MALTPQMEKAAQIIGGVRNAFPDSAGLIEQIPMWQIPVVDAALAAQDLNWGHLPAAISLCKGNNQEKKMEDFIKRICTDRNFGQQILAVKT